MFIFEADYVKNPEGAIVGLVTSNMSALPLLNNAFRVRLGAKTSRSLVDLLNIFFTNAVSKMITFLASQLD
ncbi:MAG: hypothetical protein COB24_00075 [Hyphomicrobiales bacterium]|nr:MAG: hypothetical protein COB24_00075 [Hyphomicrobiales bacterium]